MSDQETIFAVASGQGAAGVSVIRLSGNRSWSAIALLTRKPLPTPRRLSRRYIHAADGSVLDDAMVVLFTEGASFTGQKAAEVQCHGSRAVIDVVLRELGEIEDCRVAEPGEFTRRAFDNGRMDLNEVEGLGDLIRAETEFQRRQALRIMSGAASDQVSKWRSALVRARALIEVTIDWADEEVPEDVSPEFLGLVSDVASEIDAEVKRFNRTERLREGFEVAIVGSPNVGKSTLINAIAGRDVAITSDIAGTTRDVIETRCDLRGLPVTILDTAGIRESSDTIEQAGVDIALKRARAADLRLLLKSSVEDTPFGEVSQPGDITVWTKSDLAEGPADVLVSAAKGQGVDKLLEMVSDRLSEQVHDLGVFGHQRQLEIMQKCQRSIERASAEMGTVDAEVLAEHLRTAIAELDSLLGKRAVEDVLGEVFSSFCLGK